jgi:hypothetical protein
MGGTTHAHIVKENKAIMRNQKRKINKEFLLQYFLSVNDPDVIVNLFFRVLPEGYRIQIPRISGNYFDYVSDMVDIISGIFNLMDTSSQDVFFDRLRRQEDFNQPFLPPYFIENVFDDFEDTINTQNGSFNSNYGPDALPDVALDTVIDLLNRIRSYGFGGEAFFNGIYGEIIPEISENKSKYKVLYWTILTFLSIRSIYRRIATSVPGFYDFSVGFLDPESESNGFGIIVLAKSQTRENINSFLGNLRVSGMTFPIFLRNIRIIEHRLPSIHPINGTASCWVVSKRINGSNERCILVAKHTISDAIGSEVKFIDGSLGKVLDVAPLGIDAAIVSTKETSFGQHMKPAKTIVSFTEATFTGATSGQVNTFVTATNDQFGIINSAHLPIRLHLSHSGEEGDSGAMIMESSTSKGMGIYLGKVIDPAGRSTGLAQHLNQVIQIMGIEVLK